jgi:hypothetical protein
LADGKTIRELTLQGVYRRRYNEWEEAAIAEALASVDAGFAQELAQAKTKGERMAIEGKREDAREDKELDFKAGDSFKLQRIAKERELQLEMARQALRMKNPLLKEVIEYNV